MIVNDSSKTFSLLQAKFMMFYFTLVVEEVRGGMQSDEEMTDNVPSSVGRAWGELIWYHTTTKIIIL